jgi:hypothetical protein
MVFGFVFIAMAAWHLFFNWRALMTYLRSRMHAGFSRPRELAAAMAGSLALVVLTLANVTPVSLVAEYREELAESWATNDSEPPVPHIELKTVAEAAKIAEAPAEQALARLRAAGYDATPERSLADRGTKRPPETGLRAHPDEQRTASDVAMALASGGGLGRKTLATVAGVQIPSKAVSARRPKGTATPTSCCADRLVQRHACPALVEHLSAIR